MQFTATQIAMLIGGKVEGNADATAGAFAKIEEAGEGDLGFLSNPKYEDHIYSTGASIIIVNESLELKQPVSATLIRVADAYSAFATLLEKYQQMKTQQMVGIQQPVYMDPTAKIGDEVFVGAFSYIGEKAIIGKGTKIYSNVFIGDGVQVGNNCIFHPGVKIYHQCIIGDNVIVQSGAIIGGDGFGFAPLADGSYKKIPQLGNVILEDDVEIGSNTTIDRATLGSTIIRKGAKLDNLLQVGHNAEVGEHCVIAAQTGISGSTKIGNRAMIGGQVGIVGHIQIADGTKINAQSGVSKSIKTPNTAVTGSPAFEFTAALRSQAAARKLPDLEKRVRELEELVKSLLAK